MVLAHDCFLFLMGHNAFRDEMCSTRRAVLCRGFGG